MSTEKQENRCHFPNRKKISCCKLHTNFHVIFCYNCFMHLFFVKGEVYITEDELTQIADQFLQKNYGVTLDIPIKRNNRLRTTLGRYVVSHDDKPLRIEIAGNTLRY